MKSAEPFPRRILMTADTVGGVWNFALTLCRRLTDCEILLATMGGRASAIQLDQARQLSNVKLVDSDFLLEWMHDPWRDVADAGEWLLALADRFQPDLVHLNGYVHASLPWRVPVVVTAHSCVLSWWKAVRKTELPAEWDTYRARVRKGLLAADLLTAPSATMMRDLRDLHHIGCRQTIIHNGVEPPPEDGSLPQKQPLFLTAGRLWDEAKNVRGLAEIACDLPWPVVMAGAAPASSEWQFANARLAGQVAPAEMRQLFRQATIYAHPARYEPFGLAVLEAALCGCALVLGDIDSLREIWGEAAVFVDPEDKAVLRDALLVLAGDPQECARMAGLARCRAEQFTADLMARGYRDGYQKLTTFQQPLVSAP
jgi:glycogen synthase